MAFFRKLPWNQRKPPVGSALNWSDPINQGLRFCALLNEGGTLVRDLVGQDIGTLTSSPTWIGGRWARALKFDGVAAYIQTNLNLSAGIPNDGLTISAWFKPTNASSNGGIVCVSDETGVSSTVNEWGLIQVSAQAWAISQASNLNQPATGAIAAGQWYHGVAVFAAANSRLIYLNGKQAGSSSNNFPVSATTKKVRIGWRGGNLQPFNGIIENVRVYGRVITPAEIARLYAEPFAGILNHRGLTLNSAATGGFLGAWASRRQRAIGTGVI